MTEHGALNGVRPQQTDGFFRYYFQERAKKSGGGSYTLIRIEAADPTVTERLDHEVDRAREVTAALREYRNTEQPHTLAWHSEAQPGDGRPALLLRTRENRSRGRFLEPAVQERPDTLPLTPGQVRQVGIDLFEALADLHRVGYAHGDVSAHNLIWDGRHAVLTRYHAAVHAPGGGEQRTDIAAAARLLHYVATAIPLPAGTRLPPETRRELNKQLRGLGDLVAHALAPPAERIDAPSAHQWMRESSVPPDTPQHHDHGRRVEDSDAERAAREAFRDQRNKYREVRRVRYPPEHGDGSGDHGGHGGYFLPDQEVHRSPWRVLLDEGAAASVRQAWLRRTRDGTGTRLLTVLTAVAAVVVLSLLVGRML